MDKSLILKIKKFLESKLFYKLLPLILLVVLSLVFNLSTKGRFMQTRNLLIIFEQALIVGTCAIGASFIYSTGNVNLAMGATTVLSATIAIIVYNATESIVLMMLSAIVVSMVLLIVSALLSTILNVRVMFVTIVAMSLFVAIQQSLIGGSTVSVPYNVIQYLTSIKFQYISFAIFFIFAIILFNYTKIGRSLKMIGTNKECAFQTGISFKNMLLIAFMVAGLGSGLAAILAIIRGGSMGQQSLSSLNNDCMLAIVLGGMSIFGGSRSYVAAGIIGALIVCVLNQGLMMVGVNATIIQAIRGVVFLILVFTSQTRPKALPAPEG